jgi:hypothetical protein
MSILTLTGLLAICLPVEIAVKSFSPHPQDLSQYQWRQLYTMAVWQP